MELAIHRGTFLEKKEGSRTPPRAAPSAPCRPCSALGIVWEQTLRVIHGTTKNEKNGNEDWDDYCLWKTVDILSKCFAPLLTNIGTSPLCPTAPNVIAQPTGRTDLSKKNVHEMLRPASCGRSAGGAVQQRGGGGIKLLTLGGNPFPVLNNCRACSLVLSDLTHGKSTPTFALTTTTLRIFYQPDNRSLFLPRR